MDILLTNRKLPPIHSESVSRSRSKASTYRCADKKQAVTGPAVAKHKQYWRYIAFTVKSIPNDKILDVTKLKAFAEENLNVDRMTNSLFDRVENTVGKEKMLVTKIFFFFHSVF